MIILEKGSSISLEKDGRAFEYISIGLNWGSIKGFMGLWTENVDLDGSATMFDQYNNEIDTVYYRKCISSDNSITHTGDDRTGDLRANDSDNEIINIDLNKVTKSIQTIVIYLNSYNGKDFDTIPNARIRIWEGGDQKPSQIIASFNLSSEPKFKGKLTMIMAKLIRINNSWQFKSIGEPTDTKKISDTIAFIKKHYL